MSVAVKNSAGVWVPAAGSVSNSYAPIGAIYPYGGSSAPSGYLMCDGSAVSRTDYSALFAVIGTSFGVGDGSTTFNVPDLRECVPVGVDENGTQTIAAHDVYVLGQFKDDQLQNHKHYRYSDNTNGNAYAGTNGIGAWTNTKDTGAYGSETGSIYTGRTGTTTHGKQLGVNYIIKAKDVNLSVGGQALADRVSELETKLEELVLGGVIEADTLPAVPDNYIYNVKNVTTIGALFSDILAYGSSSSGNEYIKKLSKYYISGNASVWDNDDEWGKRLSGTLIFDVPITVPEMVEEGYTFPAGNVSKINIRDGEWNSGGYNGCAFVYTDGSVVGNTSQFGLNSGFSKRADQIVMNVPKVYSKGTQLVTMQDFNIFKNTIS